MTDGATSRNRFTREQWFSLPMPLRVRWWGETDYGKNEPPADLMKEIDAALGVGELEKDRGK